QRRRGAASGTCLCARDYRATEPQLVLRTAMASPGAAHSHGLASLAREKLLCLSGRDDLPHVQRRMWIVTTSSLRSRRIAVPNASAAIQDYYEAQGWTDGLPVVPATEDLVWELLGTFGGRPAQSRGVIQPRNEPVTVD